MLDTNLVIKIEQLIKEIKDIRRLTVELINDPLPPKFDAQSADERDVYIKKTGKSAEDVLIEWRKFSKNEKKFETELRAALKAAGKSQEEIDAGVTEALEPIRVLYAEYATDAANASKAHPNKVPFIKEFARRAALLNHGESSKTGRLYAISPNTYSAHPEILINLRDITGTDNGNEIKLKDGSIKQPFFEELVAQGQKIAAGGVKPVVAGAPVVKKAGGSTVSGISNGGDIDWFDEKAFKEGHDKVEEHSDQLQQFLINAKKKWNEFSNDAQTTIRDGYKKLTGDDQPTSPGATAPGAVHAPSGAEIPGSKAAKTPNNAGSETAPALKPDPEMLNLLKDMDQLQHEMISLIVTDMHPVSEKSRKAEKQAKKQYITDEVGQARLVYGLWRQYNTRVLNFKEQLVASGKSEAEIVAALAPLERAQWNMEMDVAMADKAHPEKIQFIKNHLSEGLVQLTSDKRWNKQPNEAAFYNDVTGKQTNNIGLFDHWVQEGNARLDKGGKITNPLPGQNVDVTGATGSQTAGASTTAADETPAQKAERLKKEAAANTADDSWWGKTKEWFSKLPGASMAGGAVGGMLGYMGGKIFGEGVIGSIFSMIFAVVGAIFGAKFAGDRWGNKDNTNPLPNGNNQFNNGQNGGRGGQNFQNNSNNGQSSSQQQYDPYPATPGFGWPQAYPQVGYYPNLQYAAAQYHQNSNYGTSFDVRDLGAGNNFNAPNMNHNGHPRGNRRGG